MKTVVITGASGYVGGHLASALLRDGSFRVRVLSRAGQIDGFTSANVELIKGDLMAPTSLTGLFDPDCIVVNLVYLWGAGEAANVAAVCNLVTACKSAGIRRLIHLSTAAVSGRANGDLVDEETSCAPVDEYGITKLKLEQLLIDMSNGWFDLVVVRPTAIFGVGGKQLKKLANDLLIDHKLLSYTRSSLFGSRRMNLVCIENVVAAIVFLITFEEALRSDIFIVSDDDALSNNFRDVESALLQGFGLCPYRFPRVPIPLTVLRFLLLVFGRSNINPRCNYDGQKLRRLGFQRPKSFETGLSDYISSYPSTLQAKEKTFADT